MPSVITLEISDGFILSVMFPRETFFLARAYPSVRPSVCPSVGVFFICDRISDENGIYRRLLYRRTCSVGESVGMVFTDGMSPSVKLDNFVVYIIFFSLFFVLILLFFQFVFSICCFFSNWSQLQNGPLQNFKFLTEWSPVKNIILLYF